MKYWTLSDDPHAEREAQKYDNPAPSREYLLAALESYGKPITHENLSRMLGIEDEDHLEAVRRRLAAMERDGQVLRDRRGAYALIDKLDLIKGKVLGHRDGFGFVLRDDGKSQISSCRLVKCGVYFTGTTCWYALVVVTVAVVTKRPLSM